jgi:hypothetical protein
MDASGMAQTAGSLTMQTRRGMHWLRSKLRRAKGGLVRVQLLCPAVAIVGWGRLARRLGSRGDHVSREQ